MGVTLTDVLLFGKAQSDDVDNATLVIYRRNILRWSALGGYLDIIVHGVAPLSLPDAIADSLSYVKAFGGTEQRNVPAEYVENQFIYMLDGAYLTTNIVPTSDMRIELDIQTTSITTDGHAWLGARNGSAGSGLCVGNDGTRKLFFDGCSGTRYTSTVTAVANTRYKYTWNNGVATIESGGSVVATNTFTPSDTITVPLVINGLNSSGSVVLNNAGIYFYGMKIWNAQGELVADYVPATLLNPLTVGIYDRVSKTHLLPTSGTWSAGPALQAPTPDTPMDIVSNNGVLKARHQSGLPLGYTLLDYIESIGTQYIDTGAYISTGYKVRVKAYATSIPTTTAFFGCTSAAVASDAKKGIYRLIGGTINRCAWGNGNGSVVSNLSGNDAVNTWYDMVCDNGVWTINDTLFATCPESSFTSEYSMWLFARNTGGAVGLPAACRISVCQIWDNNGQMIRNLVPCKNASNVVGMYDLVNGVFYQNAGTGDFVAGTPVSDPVEIYTDGTVETIKDSLNNTATAEMLLKVGDYQDVQSIIDGDVTRQLGVMVLTGAEVGWNYYGVQKIFYCESLTFKRDDNFAAICTHYTGKNYSQITDLTLDNIVFTSYVSTTQGVFAFRDLRFNSTTNWKQYLAAQYAAGTPVTIVYPLATETTETVTGQTLQVQAGDNILEITQASLNGLELEAKYQAAVSLTIQEVQDANLDPNVEVTIN